MRIDYIIYALRNLAHKKMRSWLTILSILIGIAAIFSLVSFGQGLSDYVNSLSSQIGTDKLIIAAKGVGAPGTDQTFAITDDDIEFLSKVKGIDEIVGLYANTVEVENNNQKKYVFAISVPQGKEKHLVEETYAIELDKGRELISGDKFKAAVGYNYQFDDEIFKDSVPLRSTIKVNGHDVKVIGFYKSVGNPQDDSQMYFTTDGMELLFPDKIGKYAMALARVNENYDAEAVAEKATERLRKNKGQKEGQEDFYIQSFAQAIETFTNIITIINGMLFVIAFISLIVAAVNIMNTMYTAVLERTREIGVMKAVGARNSDIMFMFVFESGLLGLVGGILGIILGFIIAETGGLIALNAGYGLLKPSFPLWLIIGCMIFAFIVGAASGFLPARQASALAPTEALRYE